MLLVDAGEKTTHMKSAGKRDSLVVCTGGLIELESALGMRALASVPWSIVEVIDENTTGLSEIVRVVDIFACDFIATHSPVTAF